MLWLTCVCVCVVVSALLFCGGFPKSIVSYPWSYVPFNLLLGNAPLGELWGVT